MVKSIGGIDERPVMGSQSHKISMTARKEMTIDGVTNVESFDDQEVVLSTTEGLLIVHGKDLHIKQLNLDNGNLAIEGYVDGLQYEEERETKGGRGFIGRLLR